jgi:hypothetical protein
MFETASVASTTFTSVSDVLDYGLGFISGNIGYILAFVALAIGLVLLLNIGKRGLWMAYKWVLRVFK